MTADIVGAKVTCFAFLAGVEVDEGAEEAGLEEGDEGRALAGVDEVGVEVVFNLLKRASISSKMLVSASC